MKLKMKFVLLGLFLVPLTLWLILRGLIEIIDHANETPESKYGSA